MRSSPKAGEESLAPDPRVNAYGRIATIVEATERDRDKRSAPFELLFALSTELLAIVDLEGTLLRVNPALAAILGGYPTSRTAAIEAIAIPEDRGRLEGFLGGLVNGPGGATEVLTGDVATCRIVSDAGDRSARVVSWRGGVSRELIYLVGRIETTEVAASASPEPEDPLRSIAAGLGRGNRLGDREGDELVGSLGEELGWEAAALWLPAIGENYLRCAGYWGHAELADGDFSVATREIRFERGLGLIGRVWWTRQEEWVDDVTTLSDYVRIGPARREHLRTTFALPIEGPRGCEGVIEFYSRRTLKPVPSELERIRRLAREIGEALATS